MIKGKKKKTIIFGLLFVLFITIFSISIYNIVKWKIDSNKTDEQINKITDNTDINEISDSKNTEIIKPQDKDKSSPYWDYIKMNLIDVDFENLKSTNNQTKGWIQVKGTNINYPVVQANDNKYYLTHSFDKSYNDAGWVFLDYRNKINGSEKNTIIYAHGRYDQTMFGSLKNILTSGWLNNTDNYVVKLSTEYENSLWQVFSVYRIPTTSDYLQTYFKNNSEFIKFTNKLIKRSSHDFKTTINKTDKIITLSTCYNNEDKVVLHAKLIKKENKK